MALTKAQPYHFFPNAWHVLGSFRYFNEKTRVQFSLDDLLSLYQVRYFAASKLSPLPLVERVPKNPKNCYKESLVKVQFSDESVGPDPCGLLLFADGPKKIS